MLGTPFLVLLTLLLVVVVPIITTTQAYAQITPTTNATGTTTNTTNATSATNATGTNTTAAVIGEGGVITALIWNTEIDLMFLPSTGIYGEEIEREAGGEEIIQLSPQNIEYQRTDPGFLKLAQTTADCITHLDQFKEGIRTLSDNDAIEHQGFCLDIISQGVAQYCESTDFATFDIAKCEEARTMTDTYLGAAEILYG